MNNTPHRKYNFLPKYRIWSVFTVFTLQILAFYLYIWQSASIIAIIITMVNLFLTFSTFFYLFDAEILLIWKCLRILLSFIMILLISAELQVFIGHPTYYLHPVNPTSYHDMSIPNLDVELKYEKQMLINHPYIVTVTLISKQKHMLLSQLNGSLTSQKNASVNGLLGKDNAHCVSISLVTDQSSFAFSPSEPQVFSLDQEKLTLMWSIKPLLAADQAQTIPINIVFRGELHCGSGDILQGSYPLDNSPTLKITVSDPNNTILARTTNNPAFNTILTAILTIFAGFIGWCGSQIWVWIRRKKAIRDANDIKQEAEDIKKRAFEEADAILKAARDNAENIKKNLSMEVDDIRKKANDAANQLVKKTLEDSAHKKYIDQQNAARLEEERLRLGFLKDMENIRKNIP